MSDSNLSRKLGLAHQALLLVTTGVSEREAIARSSASARVPPTIKREVLALVLGIVREQDTLDRIIRSVLSEDQFGMFAQCLFRLVAFVSLKTRHRRQLISLEHSLREIVPNEYRSKVELLSGTLPISEDHLPALGLQDSEHISLETHHPVWWVEYCLRTFGRSETIDLLSANPRPRYLRVNPLTNGGRVSIPSEARTIMERLVKVPSMAGVYSLKGSPSAFSGFFSRGLFQLQDLASFLAVKAADPRPGENVLELCAAPGAKTSAVAQLMKNRGRIVSVDYSRSRMRTWKREVQRLGVRIAEPVISDARRLGVHGGFDLVIVDPPCTGTGILDRNPRMKWHLSAQSLDHYSALQQQLLGCGSSALGDEGRILYCTCSVTLEENENVVSRFLKSHPEFETRSVLEEFGSPGLRGMSDCRRFYPHRDRTAGYFVSRMERVN